MEDLKLKLTASDDDTPIQVTEELKKAVEDHIKKFRETFGLLNYMIEQNTLNKGMTINSMSIMDYSFHDVCKALGVESPEQKKVSELQQTCREVHAQNRELRQQLGAKVSLEDSRENIKNIIQAMRKWWEKESAFGWLNEIRIEDYGCLCCQLSTEVGYGCGHSEEEYLERAKAQGYELVKDQGNYYPKATTENMEKIRDFCGMIGCKVRDFKIEVSFDNKTDLYIHRVNVLLREYSKLQPWYGLKEE